MFLDVVVLDVRCIFSLHHYQHHPAIRFLLIKDRNIVSTDFNGLKIIIWKERLGCFKSWIFEFFYLKMKSEMMAMIHFFCLKFEKNIFWLWTWTIKIFIKNNIFTAYHFIYFEYTLSHVRITRQETKNDKKK